MVTFEFDGESRTDGEISADWIAEKFREASKRNTLPCFRFNLDTTSAKIFKQTARCPVSGGVGGGRAPNPEEAQVLALWERCGLNEPDYSLGNVVKFLRHLEKVF